MVLVYRGTLGLVFATIPRIGRWALKGHSGRFPARVFGLCYRAFVVSGRCCSAGGSSFDGVWLMAFGVGFGTIQSGVIIETGLGFGVRINNG